MPVVPVHKKMSTLNSAQVHSDVVNVIEQLQVVEEFQIPDKLNIGGSKDHYIEKSGDNMTVHSKGDLILSSGTGNVTGGGGGGGLTDNSVTTAKLADNSVATAKLADNSVTTQKLDDNINIVNLVARGATIGNHNPSTGLTILNNMKATNLSNATTFEVDVATGNTTIGGTLSVNTDKFTVDGITGDLAVNTNQFTVQGATGDTKITGTVDAGVFTSSLNPARFRVHAVSEFLEEVTIDKRISGKKDLNLTGNQAGSGITVNTDKFTVDASNGNTVVAGTLQVSGQNVTSDDRLKLDRTTKPINPATALTTLSKLKPMTYDKYTYDVDASTKAGKLIDMSKKIGKESGFIAQDMLKDGGAELKHLVNVPEDPVKDFHSVNYIGLIAHLTAAVQELNKKVEGVDSLTKRVASLEEENAKLKKRHVSSEK